MFEPGGNVDMVGDGVVTVARGDGRAGILCMQPSLLWPWRKHACRGNK